MMTDSREVLPDGPITILITLHFGGEIPKHGLDADEVAAVAEGMAKAVQFLSGRSIDAERQHTLRLTEVRPGSAVFQFFLEVAAIAQTVLPILVPGHFSLKQVGEVFSQTVKLLEFLKGKPPTAQVAVNGNDNVVLTNSEGATVIVNQYIMHAAGNAYFQEHIGKAVKPLRRSNRTLALEQDRQKLLATTSDSYSAITAQPIKDIQPLTVNTIEATLRVRQPHLEGEDSWKFAWGRNSITAQVQDKAFMEQVRTGERDFRAGDVLRVKLRIEEQQRGKNVTKRHYIDEVLHEERGT